MGNNDWEGTSIDIVSVGKYFVSWITMELVLNQEEKGGNRHFLVDLRGILRLINRKSITVFYYRPR